MKQFVIAAIAIIALAGFSSLALADGMSKVKGNVEAVKDKKDDVKVEMKGKVEDTKGAVAK